MDTTSLDDVWMNDWQAYQFMSGNKMHIFVVNSIGAFVLLLGKLVISAVTAAAAVLWLRVSTYDFIIS